MLDITEEQYIKLLKSHDWYYFMSDDNSVVEKWSKNEDYLIEISKQNKDFLALYNQFKAKVKI